MRVVGTAVIARAHLLKFIFSIDLFIGRELGGTGTGYLFQFTYCAYKG